MPPRNHTNDDQDDDGSAAKWTAIMDGFDKILNRLSPLIIIALQLYYGAKIDTAAEKAETAAEVGLTSNKTISAWKAQSTGDVDDVHAARKAEVQLEKFQEQAANKPQAN